MPNEIISYEINPTEESILDRLLKGKNECVPSAPKTLQLKLLSLPFESRE